MRAAAEWLASFKGNQSAAAKEAQRRGVPLSQPQLGQIARGRKIGERMTDLMAALYDTTPDGLVRLFMGGVGAMPLRDVPGWDKALREAMDDSAVKVEAWVWRALGDVVVPVSLRRAEKQMVLDIARFMDYWGQVSGARKLRAAAP